jgi:hypothetical protein
MIETMDAASLDRLLVPLELSTSVFSYNVSSTTASLNSNNTLRAQLFQFFSQLQSNYNYILKNKNTIGIVIPWYIQNKVYI